LQQFLDVKMPAAHLFDLGAARDFGFAGWLPVRVRMQQAVLRKVIDKHGVQPRMLGKH
jgi:hypothetical protein